MKKEKKLIIAWILFAVICIGSYGIYAYRKFVSPSQTVIESDKESKRFIDSLERLR